MTTSSYKYSKNSEESENPEYDEYLKDQHKFNKLVNILLVMMAVLIACGIVTTVLDVVKEFRK